MGNNAQKKSGTMKCQDFVMRLFSSVYLLLLYSGCASYGVIHNSPQETFDYANTYAILSASQAQRTGDISLMLAFSGGGTRAAAFACGVLQELRDTGVLIEGEPRRLLDEVDTISSVSGGSFTSAHYGLYGDRIFEDFEEVFLRRDIEVTLIRGVLSPLQWFKETGRTEMAVKYYEEKVFHGATFTDMKKKGATDTYQLN